MALQYSDPQVFLFLSQILGKRVLNRRNKKIGKVMDLVVGLVEPYPIVTEVLLSPAGSRENYCVPWSRVLEMDRVLRVDDFSPEECRRPENREGEIFLKDTLLDKQVVDTNGAKVRRVNDLQFLKAHNLLHLVHVDVGFRGLMRRAGLVKPMDVFLQGLMDYTLADQFIAWKYIQPLSSPDLLKLKIAQDRLSQIHPADLADIIEDLDIHQRAAVFQSLDIETAAETLEETDPKIQVSLIKELKPEDASDIIEEMSLNEAADLLADLPKHQAEGILSEMEQDIAEDVKELLALPEEKAGGLMTTAFLSYPPTLTVGEALENIRREAEDMDFAYYVYVIDADEHLLGMMSLRELLVSPPEGKLEDFMDTRIVSVNIEEDEKEIANMFAKYGVMAIPVVDDDERMMGVIIFRNILEIIAPHLGK
ncbi:MAG TPA: CBS domain-containing protein [Syntrophales bacterium]|jgi:CBS domain-containing protein/sporulation protein YlmC with PRC-barrel domain|nr:CBS domain-containing protein [Syntrophales bacterium]HPX55628.1 CBS domain-containing protein [Syntrophales bacterium]HQA82108.1 CBS domain-containing protein [Syntrophales bacterium]